MIEFAVVATLVVALCSGRAGSHKGYPYHFNLFVGASTKLMIDLL
jgi:hypothetical protein